MIYFFVTDTHYWSKGATLHEAFSNLKGLTSKPCDCVIDTTDDDGAYVDGISGGVCTKPDSNTINLGLFRMSQGRLTPKQSNS